MNGRPGDKRPSSPPRCVIVRPALPGQAPQMKCYPPQKPGAQHFVVSVTAGVPQAPSLSSPLGGPASGLWPSGPGAAAAAPPPSPAPAPAPVPSCSGTVADIFSDCFSVCTGSIPPGSVCGWSFVMPYGPKGGSVVFTPGLMSLNAAGAPADATPAAQKSITLGSVLGITGQVTFTEFAAALGSGMSYEFHIRSAGGTEHVFVLLDDSGFALVQAGPSGAAGSYFGAWTPNNGTHEVHFEISGLGVPTLFVDDVAIVLAFGGASPVFGAFTPNTVVALGSSGVGTPQSMKVTRYFLTTGLLPSTTDFCCP